MLVWGGGGAWDGCCSKFCGANGPFLEFGLLAKGSVGSVLAWGHFSVASRRRKGSGGSALARGAQFRFGSCRIGPGRPARVCVLSDLWRIWGIRTGARNVRRAPDYYVVGYSGIYAGGAGSILIPFIRFRIVLPGPPSTEQTSATAPFRQLLLLNPGGGLFILHLTIIYNN